MSKILRSLPALRSAPVLPSSSSSSSTLSSLSPPRALTPTRPLSSTSSRLASSAGVAPDPWPLPLSPDTVSREQYAPKRLSDDPESWDMPKPLNRTGEDEETLRARLVYQTRKRGCLEGDLLLSTYAKERLGSMNMKEMREFDKLLDEPDWDIFYWSVEKKEAPERWRDTALLRELKQHAKNEGKVVRMMPGLPEERK